MLSGFQVRAQLPELGQTLPSSGSSISTTVHLCLQRPRTGPTALLPSPTPTAVPAPGLEGTVTQQGRGAQMPAPCEGAEHAQPSGRRFPSPPRKALCCRVRKEGGTKRGTRGRRALLEHNRVQGNAGGICLQREKGSNDARGPQGLCQQQPRRGWGGPRHCQSDRRSSRDGRVAGVGC